MRDYPSGDRKPDEEIEDLRREVESLRTKMEKYKLLFDNAGEGILVGAGGYIRAANRSALEITGYTLEELQARSLYDFIHPEDLPHVIRYREDAFAGKDMSEKLQYRGICKDGTVKWVESATSLIDWEGEIAGLSYISDITERKRMEQDLQSMLGDLEMRVRERTAEMEAANEKLMSSARGFKALFYNAPMPAYRWKRQDNDFILMDFNKAAEQVSTGLIKNYLGIKSSELYENDEDVRSILEKCYREESVIKKRMTYHYRSTNDVRELVVSYSAVPPDEVLVYTEDITARRQAEEALRVSEEHLRSLMESAEGFAVFRLKHNNRAPYLYDVMLISPSAVDIMGLDKPMDYESWFEYVHPIDRDRIVEANRRSLSSFQFNEEFRFYNSRKKQWQWLHSINTVMRGPDNKATYANGIVLDITDRKRTEKELDDYRVRLRDLAAKLSMAEERERHVIAGDLHDSVSQTLAICILRLKTLLAGMNDNKETGAFIDVIDYLDQTLKATRSLTFELSPPILYELGLEPALEWLTEKIYKEYDIETSFKAKKRSESIDENLKVILFRSTRELLINAARHSKANRVDVRSTIKNKSISIIVQDDGIGMDAGIAGSQSGEKFGIFSVRERLESIGGTLEIVSEKDKGAHITLNAPLG